MKSKKNNIEKHKKINEKSVRIYKLFLINFIILIILTMLSLLVVFECLFITDNLILWNSFFKLDFISSWIGNFNFKWIWNLFGAGTSDTTNYTNTGTYSNIIDSISSEGLEAEAEASQEVLENASEKTPEIEFTVPETIGKFSIDSEVTQVDLMNLYSNINSYYNISKSPDVAISSSIIEILTQNINQYEDFLEHFDDILYDYEEIDVMELNKNFWYVKNLQQLIIKEGLDSLNTIEGLMSFLCNEDVKVLINRVFVELYVNYKPELLEENTIPKYIVQLLKVDAFLGQLIEQIIKLNKKLNIDYNISKDAKFCLDFIFNLKRFSKFKIDYRKLIVDFKDISTSNINKHGGIASWCYMHLARQWILANLRFYDELEEEEEDNKPKKAEEKVEEKVEEKAEEKKTEEKKTEEKKTEEKTEEKIIDIPDEMFLQYAPKFLFYNYILRLRYFAKTDKENTSKVKFLFKNLNLCRYNFWVDLLKKKQTTTEDLLANESDKYTKLFNEKFLKDTLLSHIKKTIIAAKIYEMYKKREYKLKNKKHEKIIEEEKEIIKYYEEKLKNKIKNN